MRLFRKISRGGGATSEYWEIKQGKKLKNLKEKKKSEKLHN